MIGWKMLANKAITIFGGSGDLTYRKLLPSMYNLEVLGKLEDSFKIIIVARKDYQTADYAEIAKSWVKEYSRKKFDEAIFEKFTARIRYFKMDIADTEEYRRLKDFYGEEQVGEHVYYYAVAPKLFIPITKGLEKYLSENNAKVIIEKPFGENLETAARLNEELAGFFGQDEIYHIDHYLGKEMIQNILSIRFKNAIFKGIWNRDFIESVQITAAETVGVGTRAGYYDKNGALKDMVQNHLFQVLSIVAMEEPVYNNIAQRQLELLKSLEPIEDIDSDLILGQYEGYLNEEKIKPDSKTETYAAMKLYIDNARWEGVPFYIRTGKMLGNRESQVVIKFKPENNEISNVLVIKIQPDEGIHLRFNAKKPGTENELQTVSMDFFQSSVLENRINTPEAYERLLYACFNGDRSLFSKWDQIVVSWNYMADVRKRYEAAGWKLYTYPQGSMGPKIADRLFDWSE